MSVDVRLVGFEGDGCAARQAVRVPRLTLTPRSGGAARLSAADFAPFLEALRLDVDALALDGAAAGALVRLASSLP